MSLYIQLYFSDESALPVTKKREGVGKAKGHLGFAAAFSNKKAESYYSCFCSNLAILVFPLKFYHSKLINLYCSMFIT